MSNADTFYRKDKYMLRIEDLTMGFGKKKVIDSISFEFLPGVHGLLGPNGAGKTTLIRSMLGLYKIDAGEIFYDDIEPFTGDLAGYLPQDFGLFKGMKLYDMMEYFAYYKDIDEDKQDSEIKRCINMVNLSDCMKKRVGKFSGGMIRRVGIAQALLGDPKVLIFDEPTASLDPEERNRFKSIINKVKQDKVVIIATHDVDTLRNVCDYLEIIKDGKFIFTGTVDDLLKKAPDTEKEPTVEEGYLSVIGHLS